MGPLQKNALFKKIFEDNGRNLVLFANKYVKDQESAEDIVQDAFLSLWERIHKFSNEKAIKSFLYITTKNKCINFLKRNGKLKEAALEQMSSEDFFHENYIKVEHAHLIHNTIARLPDMQKEVFIRSYLYEQPRDEIAEHFGITLNTIQTHLKRAKTFLRNNLKSKVFYLVTFFLFSFLG